MASHGIEQTLGNVGHASLAVVRHEAGLTVERHDHTASCLHIVLEGVYVEVVEGRVTLAPAGWVVAKAEGTDHANVFGTVGSKTLRVETSGSFSLRTSCAPRWLGEASRSRSRSSRTWHPEDLAALLDRLDRDTPGDAGHVVFDAAERLASSGPQPNIGEMAIELGVERTALAHQFRRRFGCSMARWVNRNRVARAVSRITGGESLAEAAVAAGFYDQPHFCREFRALLGDAPSAWLRRTERLVAA